MAEKTHRTNSEWSSIVNLLLENDALSMAEIEARTESPERVRDSLDELCDIGMLNYDAEATEWTTTEMFTGFGSTLAHA